MVAFICGKNLDMHVEKTFKFGKDQVIEAFKYLESGSHVGKIVIELK